MSTYIPEGHYHRRRRIRTLLSTQTPAWVSEGQAEKVKIQIKPLQSGALFVFFQSFFVIPISLLTQRVLLDDNIAL